MLADEPSSGGGAIDESELARATRAILLGAALGIALTLLARRASSRSRA
jgi:hypothetical protein